MFQSRRINQALKSLAGDAGRPKRLARKGSCVEKEDQVRTLSGPFFGSSFRHSTLWLLAAGFSWATVLFASGPLRALRLATPFWIFWPVSAAISSSMWFGGAPIAACGFAAVALVIGLYTDIENWGLGRGIAACVSIVALVAAVGTGFGAWCRAMKVSPVTWLTQWLEPLVVKAKTAYPTLDIDVDMIVMQLPSAIVVMGLIALAIAVLSEQTWLRFLGPQTFVSVKSARVLALKWTDFRLWDVAIFVLMLALLAALTHHGLKTVTLVGANVLNVMVVLYFFQGMAVVFKAFDFFRVGPMWRILIGFVLTFQLAVLVAVVGVADYWLEIRNRLSSRPIGPKAEL